MEVRALEMLADLLVDLVSFQQVLADLVRIVFFVCRFKKNICKHRSPKDVPKQQQIDQHFGNDFQKNDQQSINIDLKSIRSRSKSIQQTI